MSTIIIITPPTKPPGGQLQAMEDGTIVDSAGEVRMQFTSYADAIAYLQHLEAHGLSADQLAEAEDDRA